MPVRATIEVIHYFDDSRTEVVGYAVGPYVLAELVSRPFILTLHDGREVDCFCTGTNLRWERDAGALTELTFTERKHIVD